MANCDICENAPYIDFLRHLLHNENCRKRLDIKLSEVQNALNELD